MRQILRGKSELDFVDVGKAVELADGIGEWRKAKNTEEQQVMKSMKNKI